MKKWSLVVVILITIFVFLASAFLNPPATASCVRSNFYGVWKKSIPANPNDKINSLKFYYYGSNGCGIVMSIDGAQGIAMTSVNENIEEAVLNFKNGSFARIRVTFTKLSSKGNVAQERLNFVVKYIQNNRVINSYTQEFTRLRLK